MWPSFRNILLLRSELTVNALLQGTLCPDERSITPTLRSRLDRLWDHVHHSRAKFEEAPDTGEPVEGENKGGSRICPDTKARPNLN